MTTSFSGTGVALVTPFRPDLSLDLEGLGRLVDHVVDGGVDYLVVLGTTGESVTLSPSEKEQVKQTVIASNKGRLPLVLGLGGNNTQVVVSELRQTNFQGFDGILSVSPYYNKPTQEGIYRHFREISQASPLPVILYNVPSRTGSNMLPDTVIRLATECKNLVGIKEASGDMEQIKQLLQRAPSGFQIISGDDFTAVPTAIAGGSGVISVLGQAVVQEFCEMMQMGLKGMESGAFNLHDQLEPLMSLIFREGNPAGIKALLSQLGVCEPHVRLPLVPATPGLQKALSDFMHSHLNPH
ncbi:4-hydroxy-tetrahydrodipicolinate synthase [Robiginitalea sp. IMCC43444]|uniref:4-hydroxy-tetrahydrodipicolinate synthase n=1 Tax=Robiginitalea sp. IMCC43444 TaxID=3459121 RepID=UPI0040410CDD